MRLGLSALKLTAVRVRLTDGSAPSAWTPADLGASLALWLDADDASTITLNGSDVSQWDDKSGNGRNAVQATAANQPAYSATNINGKPALVFNGTSDRMSLTSSTSMLSGVAGVSQIGVIAPTALVAITNRIVAVHYTSTGTTKVGLGLGNTVANRIQSLVRRVASDASVAVAAPDDYTPNTPYVVGQRVDYSSREIDLYLDGSLGATGLTATSGLSESAAASLDSTIGSFATGAFAPVACAELILLASAISVSDRQKAEGYLAWKWGGI